ncbi:lignin peroxidase isozyme Lip4.65 [Exidia glandulosa HHB12029]|uniref:Peroxidase n=1 Tax=Exidia glandulosa HHB12029 TaxID=1314781 RepID=A0A165AZ56_EXIGL|nr:lignin peroxidase isozyme Lip4.65 [Exidia glandulosa HHB12029]
MAFTGLTAFALIAAASVASAMPAVDKRAVCADGVTRVNNLQCCSWAAVRDALIEDVFEGVCGEAAHSTVRIAFHDAIGFSKTQAFGGGADGSMIAFGDIELAYAANAGIDDIVGDLQPFADAHGISYGDVIQFGSSVALSLCPGAPTVRTFVGRKNATAAAPDGTVPDPFNPVTDILARMADAGFSSDEVIALLASHSIAAQDEIEPTIAGAPFDSTPDSFDPQVFLEVLLKGTTVPGGLGPGQGEVQSPLEGEFRLQSDAAFARDRRTACTWQSFINNQALMASRFSAAMAKLAVLGQNTRTLVDCTEVIPAAPAAKGRTAIIPAGKKRADIEASCPTAAFPALPTATGAQTTVAPVPPQ